MAFTINLYRYEYEANVLNKQLTGLGEFPLMYTGTLKEGSSILTPTVLIQDSTHEGIVEDKNAPYRIVSRNYAYIEQFKRYYFITDIRSVNTNLWEIDMRVDVLKTYKDYIYRMPAFISRCEVKYNQLIRDPLIPLKYERVVTTEEHTYGKIFQANPEDAFEGDKYPILVVNVAGAKYNTNNRVVNGTTPYDGNVTIPSSFFAPVAQTLQTVFLRGKDLIRDFVLWLQSEEGGSRAASYIASMFLVPCIDFIAKLNNKFGFICPSPDKNQEYTFLTIGDLDFKVNVTDYENYDGDSLIAIQGGYMRWSDEIKIEIEYPRDFMLYEPYAIRELYIPFYGWYRLNSKLMIQDTRMCTKIILHHMVDYYTGIDSVDIVYQFDDETYMLGDKLSVSFLIPEPVGATTADAVNRQYTNNVLSLVGGVLSGAGQAVVGTALMVASGGTVGAGQMVGGVMNAVSAGLDYAGKEAMNVEYGKISPTSSSFGLLTSPVFYIYRVSRQATVITGFDEDEFRHLYGAPVSAPVEHLIDAVYEEGNYLKGWKYVKCASVHVEDTEAKGLYATDEEKSEIETLLMNGVQI